MRPPAFAPPEGVPAFRRRLVARYIGVTRMALRRRPPAAPDPADGIAAATLDGIPVACVLLGRDHHIAHLNPAAERLFGFAAADVVGRLPKDLLVPAAHWENSERRFRYLAEGATHAEGVSENLRKDGGRLICEWHNAPLRDAGGRFSGVLGVAIDVTERTRVTEELARRDAQYRRLLTNIPEVVWTADETGACLFISDAVTAVSGYTPAEELGADAPTWLERVHPDDRDAVQRAWHALFAEGRPYAMEYRIRHKRGHWVWWFDRAVEVYDRDGKRYADGLYSDITERKAGEAALRASEESYRVLFQLNPVPMWVFDVETLAFLQVNDAAVAHYGYTRGEFLGMRLPDIRLPEDVPSLHEDVRRLAESGRGGGRWRHRKKGGEIITVEVNAHTLTFEGRRAGLVIVQDVTGEIALEEQLRQAQKLEAIGQLSGGIAHDLNNVLTAVIAHVDLALSSAGPGEDRDDLVQAGEAAHRGAELIRKLLAFSRRERLQMRPLALGALVEEFLGTLRRMLPEHIEIITSVAEGVLPIHGDAGAVQQVLLNLATNARDAMPAGGTLRVAVDAAELDEEHIALHGWGRPGRYARLTLSDSGEGMTPEVRAHLFEPFFTTKQPGLGTGLGMAMVYGLVKQHRGFVFVYSEPGHGTTVRVYFPVAATEPARRPAAPEPARAGNRRETIMVVEDEEPIRRAARRVLERHGYDVVVASDGAEALQVIRAGTAVDLVISDAIMPRMGGLALYETLARERPGVPFLLTSGYTGAEVAEQHAGSVGLPFLPKPWTMADLLSRVRAVLDGTAT